MRKMRADRPVAIPTRGYRRIGVAVSGGADSCALLRLLAGERSHDPQLYTCVLHVDHGMRPDSASDAEFVKRLAGELGLPFFSKRFRVRPSKGMSPEMAAREARLSFFRECTQRLSLDAIATGHHADDAIETFFLRLARGAGLSGLAGLKPVSRIPGITFIRPLINTPDKALRAWLRSMGCAWREDSTNADTSIARNLVRRRVIPYLEKTLDRSLRAHVAQTLDILREEDEFMEAAAHEAMERGTPFSAMPAAVARRAARAFLRSKGLPDGFRETAEFLERGGVPPAEEDREDGARAEARFTLAIAEDRGWRPATRGIGKFPSEAWLSAESIAGRSLEVRPRRPGDRIHASGVGGAKKIQDVFTDLKVPRRIRSTLPLLASDAGEVLWVPGWRVSSRAAVPDGKSRSWHFTLSPDADVEIRG